jgi:hypothetical protein
MEKRRTGLGVMMRYLALLCVVFLVAACATKRYDRLQSVSALEAAEYDCKDIQIELSKVAEARRQMAEQAEIDMASVMGFLGDFGIGNAMEKNAAEKTIVKREQDLLRLQAAKDCL